MLRGIFSVIALKEPCASSLPQCSLLPECRALLSSSSVISIRRSQYLAYFLLSEKNMPSPLDKKVFFGWTPAYKNASGPSTTRVSPLLSKERSQHFTLFLLWEKNMSPPLDKRICFPWRPQCLVLMSVW